MIGLLEAREHARDEDVAAPGGGMDADHRVLRLDLVDLARAGARQALVRGVDREHALAAVHADEA